MITNLPWPGTSNYHLAIASIQKTEPHIFLHELLINRWQNALHSLEEIVTPFRFWNLTQLQDLINEKGLFMIVAFESQSMSIVVSLLKFRSCITFLCLVLRNLKHPHKQKVSTEFVKEENIKYKFFHDLPTYAILKWTKEFEFIVKNVRKAKRVWLIVQTILDKQNP